MCRRRVVRKSVVIIKLLQMFQIWAIRRNIYRLEAPIAMKYVFALHLKRG